MNRREFLKGAIASIFGGVVGRLWPGRQERIELDYDALVAPDVPEMPDSVAFSRRWLWSNTGRGEAWDQLYYTEDINADPVEWQRIGWSRVGNRPGIDPDVFTDLAEGQKLYLASLNCAADFVIHLGHCGDGNAGSV